MALRNFNKIMKGNKMRNIVLLSGEPRVGKTTALKKIIQMIGECNCIGFYTEEVRNEFDRVGFDCVSLDGIDVGAFEDFALRAISNSLSTSKIIIIDEIGPIQFLSTKFKHQIKNILTGSNCVIGTIFYNKHPEIDEIKKIPGIKIYSMSNENRNTIIEEIYHEIQFSIS